MRSKNLFSNIFLFIIGILITGLLVSSCETYRSQAYNSRVYGSTVSSNRTQQPSNHTKRNIHRQYSKYKTRQPNWNATTSQTTNYYIRKNNTRNRYVPKKKKNRY